MDTAALTLYFQIAAFALMLAVALLYLGTRVYRQQALAHQQQCQDLQTEIGLMEAERNRIARDLHDELGSYLYMIKSQIGALEGANEEERVLATRAAGHIDYVIDRMNGITRNMSPHILQDFGLEEALMQYLSYMQESSTSLLRFSYCCTVAMRPESSLHVYRMAQELVANASKHACASYVQLSIGISGGQLVLECRDNGKGIKNESGTGLGMHSLRRRAALLGGQADLLPGEGTGTHIIISIPISMIQDEPPH